MRPWPIESCFLDDIAAALRVSWRSDMNGSVASGYPWGEEGTGRREESGGVRVYAADVGQNGHDGFEKRKAFVGNEHEASSIHVVDWGTVQGLSKCIEVLSFQYDVWIVPLLSSDIIFRTPPWSAADVQREVIVYSTTHAKDLVDEKVIWALFWRESGGEEWWSVVPCGLRNH